MSGENTQKVRKKNSGFVKLDVQWAERDNIHGIVLLTLSQIYQ